MLIDEFIQVFVTQIEQEDDEVCLRFCIYIFEEERPIEDTLS